MNAPMSDTRFATSKARKIRFFSGRHGLTGATPGFS